jgi:phage baseplate assembly protein W
MIRYKGIAYPLTKHHQGFLHNSETDLEQIKSNLATILLTEPGERIMNPVFGCALSKVYLNQPKEIVLKSFKDKVTNSLRKWEQRIQINDVQINLQTMKDESTGDELVIMISIYFIDPIKLNETQALHVQKSLGGVNGRKLPF